MSKDITAKLKRLETMWNWIDNSESKYVSDMEDAPFQISELMKRFKVSRRTVLRDIALIKEMGIEFYYRRSKRYKGPASMDSEFNFALEKLHLTSQAAAALCIAYEAAKQGGKAFEPACQYIKDQFVPDIPHCEINPKLPFSPLLQTIKKAIENRYYLKITTDKGVISSVKPYLLIRIAKKRVELLFLKTRKKMPIKIPIDRYDDFFIIALENIKKAVIAKPSKTARSPHFPSVQHRRWDAYEEIAWHVEQILAQK